MLGLNGGEIIFLIVVGATILFVASKIKGIKGKGSFTSDEADEAARIKAYKNHIYPIGIFAHSLVDNTILQRAKDERERLTQNKNPYDDAVPILAFYPNSLFSITIGKELVTADFIGLPYHAYIKLANETYLRAHALWMQELKRQNIASDDDIAQLVNGQILNGKQKNFK